ncbi:MULTISPECIES: hypothetical protein, partial [unclassified Burkholderia]|uniref:hypothetical protein n=1 Tax=unclassified Burkholderia TaxID=2613784 RepID=UPI001ABA31B1
VSVNSRVSGQQQALLHWKRAESATQEPVQTLVQAPVPLESARVRRLNFVDNRSDESLSSWSACDGAIIQPFHIVIQ